MKTVFRQKLGWLLTTFLWAQVTTAAPLGQKEYYFERPERALKVPEGFFLSGSLSHGYSNNVTASTRNIASHVSGAGASVSYAFRSSRTSHIALSARGSKTQNHSSRQDNSKTYQLRARSFMRTGSRSKVQLEAGVERMSSGRHLDNFLNNEKRDEQRLKYAKFQYTLGRERSKGFLDIKADYLEWDYMNNLYSSTNRAEFIRRTTSLETYFEYRYGAKLSLELLSILSDNQFPFDSEKAYRRVMLAGGGNMWINPRLYLEALIGTDISLSEQGRNEMLAFFVSSTWWPRPRSEIRIDLIRRLFSNQNGSLKKSFGGMVRWTYLYSPKIRVRSTMSMSFDTDLNTEKEVLRQGLSISLGYDYVRGIGFSLSASSSDNMLSPSDEDYDRKGVFAGVQFYLM